ncbi:MAG: arsenate reductase ArsC [Chloroflexi bacterium]|nr:arsenate reductase ArsC [Chloroflexota bacterium]
MKPILFVCVHNSGRSQMAEAFFNRLAAGRAVAISAGTAPAVAVDPTVVRVMREVGVDTSHNKPKRLTGDMLAGAARVITMGCEVEGVCPATFVNAEDWGIEDPKGKPAEMVREIRDRIREKVTRLLEEIRESCPENNRYHPPLADRRR